MTLGHFTFAFGCEGIGAHLQQLAGFLLILIKRFLNELRLDMLKLPCIVALQNILQGLHIFLDPLCGKADHFGTHVA